MRESEQHPLKHLGPTKCIRQNIGHFQVFSPIMWSDVVLNQSTESLCNRVSFQPVFPNTERCREIALTLVIVSLMPKMPQMAKM